VEGEVFETASMGGFTVYDASYLHLAVQNHLILVTDDQELRDKASKHVETLSGGGILSRLD
jgi:predicted nucleic acid-binding protein